ncbi:helix-turn-helix domain-containing protein [Ruegeria sp. Ofav3-42]|uniref:helix-turn-helix domain-containing protein n=1 Tax=Ruegeria sp. Ofav3-42 TaxID=2917759 RepID=UPI001EF678AF|nr:helix-turn-helix domain-containing protein [Ruegeria sp. Ofav3-42]MCG7522542.1 helix-turn-helix domain-containing protein [Ruegeria sp. Ofav3-42]
MYNVEKFDTFDLWVEKMWRFSSPMVVHCENPGAFRGFSKTWDFGGLSITYFSAPPYQAMQTESELSKAQRKRLVLTMPVKGRCDFTQFGRFVEFGPGEGVFHVTRAPLIYNQHVPTTAWLIGIPLNTVLMHVDDPEEICTTLLSEDTPGFRAMRALLMALPDEMPNMTDRTRDVLVQTANSLICAVISELRGSEMNFRSQTARQRVRHIKGYIDLHLGDPELTPASIAEAHSISTRYLHHLFSKEETSCAKFLLSRRLEASARFITQNRNKELDAAHVSHRFGFSSTTQFRRAFAKKFGKSPAEFLKDARKVQ